MARNELASEVAAHAGQREALMFEKVAAQKKCAKSRATRAPLRHATCHNSVVMADAGLIRDLLSRSAAPPKT